MQTLKTDIRRRILSVSGKLFMEKGFRGTTTREIAREAGINLSNLYHYYESKDELFRQLLKPATDAMEALLSERHGIDGYSISVMQQAGYAEDSLQEYIETVRIHRDSLKLLLFKSQGSSLEGFKEYYVDKATRQVLEWFKTVKVSHPQINTDVSDFFIHLNNVWIFTLLEEILMHDLTEEQTRAVLSEYVRFEVTGWRELMKF